MSENKRLVFLYLAVFLAIAVLTVGNTIGFVSRQHRYDHQYRVCVERSDPSRCKQS